MVETDDEAGGQGRESRMRWLFVGRFTPAPTGRTEVVTAERAARPFEAAPLALACEVADRLGAAGGRRLVVPFGKLSDLKVAEVVRANPELAALRALAEEIGAGRREPADAALAVEEKIGPGRLADSLRTGAGGDGDARRRARDAIERAVLDSARDALGAAPAAPLEAAWRGLRLVAERAGKEIEIQLLDTDAADAAARLDAALGALPAFDRPDAVFVIDGVGNLPTLRALAGVGADYSVPVVVEGAPALLAAGGAREVPAVVQGSAALPAWDELRAEDVARWCCVTMNRVVLAVDGAGAATRVALGSPVFALAALLTQSYVATGGPGRIFGAPGALTAPGTWEVDAGRGEPLAIALETFFSIDTQTRLGARGVVGLGGPRNSDRVQLAAAPLLSSARDAAPLSAQLVTARTIRFAQWARAQIPDGTADADVVTILEQAAVALLFPNPEVARLSAVVTPLEGGRRAVVVRTLARGEWVGVPLDVTFALPLPK